MTKPTIQLKSISVQVKLSEETPCYTAKLFVDGKHFADVSNHGHGGCDMVHPVGGRTDADVKALDERIGATYPAIDLQSGGTMPECLEVLCHGIVWDHVAERNARSLLSRKILIVKEGEGVFGLKGKKTPANVEAADAHYAKDPKVRVLNTMAFAEAFKIMKQYGAA